MQHNISVLNKNFSDINPIVCGWHDCPSGYSFGPASREYYLIHYVISGEGIFKREGSTFSIKKDTMFIIRPYEFTYYKADDANPWTYIWIGFSGNLAKEFIESIGFINNGSVRTMPYLRSIFMSMKEANELKHSTEIYLVSKLYEIFAYLLESEGQKTNVNNSLLYVKRAQDFIKANYSTDISIQSLANILGIDRRYFCRVFSKETGESPQNYLVNFRLQKAAQLLCQYDYSVTQAAYSCGYNDIYNFSKIFKKKYGLSPANYKRNHTAKS